MMISFFWYRKIVFGNFSDDNTLYVCDLIISDVLRRLHKDLEVVIGWFACNDR